MKMYQYATAVTLVLMSSQAFAGPSHSEQLKQLEKADPSKTIEQLAAEGATASDPSNAEFKTKSAAQGAVSLKAPAAVSKSGIKTQASVVLNNGGEGSSGGSGNIPVKSSTVSYDAYMNNNAGIIATPAGEQTVSFGNTTRVMSTGGITSTSYDTKVSEASK